MGRTVVRAHTHTHTHGPCPRDRPIHGFPWGLACSVLETVLKPTCSDPASPGKTKDLRCLALPSQMRGVPRAFAYPSSNALPFAGRCTAVSAKFDMVYRPCLGTTSNQLKAWRGICLAADVLNQCHTADVAFKNTKRKTEHIRCFEIHGFGSPVFVCSMLCCEFSSNHMCAAKSRLWDYDVLVVFSRGHTHITAQFL